MSTRSNETQVPDILKNFLFDKKDDKEYCELVRNQTRDLIQHYRYPLLLDAILANIESYTRTEHRNDIPLDWIVEGLALKKTTVEKVLEFAVEHGLVTREELRIDGQMHPRIQLTNPVNYCYFDDWFVREEIIERKWLTPKEISKLMKNIEEHVAFSYYKKFVFSQEQMQKLREQSLQSLQRIFEAEDGFLCDVCGVPAQYKNPESFEFVGPGEYACEQCNPVLPTEFNLVASFACIDEALRIGFDKAEGTLLSDKPIIFGGEETRRLLSAINITRKLEVPGRYDFRLTDGGYAMAHLPLAIQQENRSVLHLVKSKLKDKEM
jgi:hypothetical protein